MGWIEERYCIAWELHYYTELRSYKELCTYIKNLYDEPQDVHSCIQFVFIKGTIACNGSKHA